MLVDYSQSYVLPSLATAPPMAFALALDPAGVYYRDSLTWDQDSQGILRYNAPVQARATTVGSWAMYVCFPTLNDVIGQLDFDPADVGHRCEVVLNGTHYQRDKRTGPPRPLTFTNGSVLLSI